MLGGFSRWTPWRAATWLRSFCTGRHLFLPRARTKISPTLVRSEMSSRSNSARRPRCRRPVCPGPVREIEAPRPDDRQHGQNSKIGLMYGLATIRAKRHVLAARHIWEAGTVIDETRETDMGPRTLAPIVLFVLLTFTCGARAQQSGRSVAPSPSPAWNDNSLITIQKTGGDPARPGDVNVEFLMDTMHSRSHRRSD